LAQWKFAVAHEKKREAKKKMIEKKDDETHPAKRGAGQESPQCEQADKQKEVAEGKTTESNLVRLWGREIWQRKKKRTHVGWGGQ